MTVLEMLKQLFGSKLDEDIDDADKPAVDKKQDLDNIDNNNDDGVNNADENNDTTDNNTSTDGSKPNNETDTTDTVDTVDKQDTLDTGGDTMDIFEEGWYDETSGRIDTSKIKNPEVLAAIQKLDSRYSQERDARAISDALKAELSNYSIRVSENTLEKMLDMSSIKVKDGKVTGIKEALDALKQSEPGIFKNKDNEDSPLNEGFNPVEKKGNSDVNTFTQAFKIMDEIS